MNHGGQVLWLFGDEHYITEVGAMNIFFALKKEGGNGIELVTPPLHAGDILEGSWEVSERMLMEGGLGCVCGFCAYVRGSIV